MSGPQRAFLRWLQALLDRLCAWGSWLALPIALLLLAQWPLRQLSGGHPQLANDGAQALFAFYVALALRHASRRSAHLRASGLFPPRSHARLLRALLLLCQLPLALLMLALALPTITRALAALERFPDTLDPGYFLLKLALGLLLLLLALQALLDALISPAEGKELAP